MEFSFKDFLEENVSVDIDPNANAAATNAVVRKAARVAGASPQRFSREQMLAAKAERKAAMSMAQDDPNASLRARVAKTKELLARLQMQLNMAEQRDGTQQ